MHLPRTEEGGSSLCERPSAVGATPRTRWFRFLDSVASALAPTGTGIAHLCAAGRLGEVMQTATFGYVALVERICATKYGGNTAYAGVTASGQGCDMKVGDKLVDARWPIAVVLDRDHGQLPPLRATQILVHSTANVQHTSSCSGSFAQARSKL